jgi:hypothetical protein
MMIVAQWWFLKIPLFLLSLWLAFFCKEILFPLFFHLFMCKYMTV